jgi:hypothetical protein
VGLVDVVTSDGDEVACSCIVGGGVGDIDMVAIAAKYVERLRKACGFNRWTQQIGEIVQRVFRSLAFSLGGYLVASLPHLVWLASR